MKYSGRDIDAMKGIAHAQRSRSLHKFESIKTEYKRGKKNSPLFFFKFFFKTIFQELTTDIVIETHLNELYDTLLEQNLLRILEPFSVVEIDHVAKLMGMPVLTIEAK